jgi:hypothetical protein
MKGINKIIADKKLTDADKIQKIQTDFGFKETTATKLVGFPRFETANSRANIKRMKDRVAQLERERNETTAEIEVGGITIKDNVEDNRVQIFYPGKPDEDTRKQLKSRGFKWSPSVGAWQRMRSRDALHYAKDIVGYKEPRFARKFDTYSEMERVLSKPGMLPNKADPKTMATAIQKHVGKFKGVELAESGLLDHIESMGGEVTRQDVLDYLDMNRIELEEVVKGESDESIVEAWWADEGGANEEVPYNELSATDRAEAIRRYREEVGD